LAQRGNFVFCPVTKVGDIFNVIDIHLLRPSVPSAALILLMWISASSVCADDAHPWSVQKLNDSKPWDLLAGTAKLRIEGRLAASSGVQFRLQHCEAVFTVEKQKLQSIPAKSNVEIKGRFRKEGSKLFFAVDDLKAVSSYTQQFDLKASRLLRPTAEDWIVLGDWASDLAAFYDDTELAGRASSAYTKSIDVEYRSLKSTNFEGRFELAKKMAHYNLSDRRRLELVHEGCRIQWDALKKQAVKDVAVWQDFAVTINDRLPGAAIPLAAEIPELQRDYLREPDVTYLKANDEQRLKLHRLFFVIVTRAILLHDASEDGHDGDAIAAQVDKLIPEEHALAETLRLKQLDYGLQHIAKATRTEAESLANAFRARQQHEAAKRVLTEWVKAHEARLKGGGIVGLIELSDEYLSLLNNRSAAIECLLEAGKIDPMYEGVRTRLTSLGYIWQYGRWEKTDASNRSTAGSQTATGVSIGMSASSLKSLLGQPRSLARAITARGTTEVWSFGPAGSTPLVVRLEQVPGEKEPKVTALSGE
jgi:hypothetical protein